MSRIPAALPAAILAAALAAGFAAPAGAQQQPETGRPEFLGIDLDNGAVTYNGRNSGRYCVYRTVEVYNTRTGYFELRRLRRCGGGLYLR